MIMLQGTLLQELLERLTSYFITGWGFVIVIGTFASALLIAFGFIYWLTGLNTRKGQKMVVGGIFLFIIMQWLAFNPPWQFLLG